MVDLIIQVLDWLSNNIQLFGMNSKYLSRTPLPMHTETFSSENALALYSFIAFLVSVIFFEEMRNSIRNVR